MEPGGTGGVAASGLAGEFVGVKKFALRGVAWEWRDGGCEGMRKSSMNQDGVGGGGRWLVALVLGALSGCMQPQPIEGPELPANFSGSGVEAVPDRWWRSFGDGQLNRAEERALDANFTLEAAWQRLRQAQAVVDRQRSGLFPDVEALLEGELSRGGGSQNFAGIQIGGGGREVQAGLAASYEIDLWGRIQSQVEAERRRAAASLADYRAAALTLSAEVARSWFALLEAWAQRDLIERQVETNEKVLKQLRVRLAEGQGRAVDVLRQEQLVGATREQKTLVEADIAVLENRLAVLQGVAPRGGVSATRQSLPEPPPLPRTGVPAELVARRPDVMAALFRVEAADADLAAAISDRFPRLDLTGFLSSRGGDGDELFDEWLRTVAAGVVAPVIDGGERAAEVRRQEALRAEALAGYRQAVLEAIGEVEDALVQEAKQGERIGELEQQLELAQRSQQQLLLEYLNGVSNYIDVLAALTEEQQLQRDLLTARRTRLEFRVGLYRALAGGFATGRESS